jgi:hypothetical protein
MAEAGELFGGYWRLAPDPVIDALAEIESVLTRQAVHLTAVEGLTAVTVRDDQRTDAYADGGRPVVGYPYSGPVPSWVSVSCTDEPAVMARGIDFEATADALLFDTDPMGTAAVRTMWVDGTPIGAASVWVGYRPAAGPELVPQDSTFAALVRAIRNTYGGPYALGTETVVAVDGSGSTTVVVTDANAYVLPSGASAVVQVGDTVSFGDPLGDTWTLTRLGPTKPDLPHLTVPASFFQGAVAGGITWYNSSVPTVVDTDSGRTRVRFSLGAESVDIFDDFWARSHANGIANGLTLAQALDTRTAPTTEPVPSTLPANVNPLELVCRELLCGNAWLLVIDSASAADAADRTDIDRAAGPYTTVFVYDDEVPAHTVRTPS